MSQKPESDLKPYYTYGMPLLVFMGLLALGGVVLTVITKMFGL